MHKDCLYLKQGDDPEMKRKQNIFNIFTKKYWNEHDIQISKMFLK